MKLLSMRSASFKIMLGAVSVAPLLGAGVLFFAVKILSSGDLHTQRLYTAASVVMSTLAAIMVLSTVLVSLFLYDLSRNKSVSKDTKSSWMFAMVLFLPFALPAYWYKMVWKAGAK